MGRTTVSVTLDCGCRRRRKLAASTERNHAPGSGGACVARIGSSAGLDQQHMSLAVSDGAVLQSLRNDEQLAWTEVNGAFRQLDGELPRQDEEEVVGVVVLMPDELALRLPDHDVVPVELGHGPGLKVLRERGERGLEVDLLHARGMTDSARLR